jgi:uncharacterized protein YbaA (DUF1428 family)
LTIEEKRFSYDNGNATIAINKDKPMPLEMKRMAYGGFSTIVNYEA